MTRRHSDRNRATILLNRVDQRTKGGARLRDDTTVRDCAGLEEKRAAGSGLVATMSAAANAGIAPESSANAKHFSQVLEAGCWPCESAWMRPKPCERSCKRTACWPKARAKARTESIQKRRN